MTNKIFAAPHHFSFNLFDASVAIVPVETTVEEINTSLGSLMLEIRKGISEDDASIFYAICNLKADEASKMATDLKPVELRYFRSVVRHQNAHHYEVYSYLSNRLVIMIYLFVLDH